MTLAFRVQHISLMSSSSTAEIKKLITSRKQPLVFITIGNTLRSDDGVGPYIASKLKSNKSLIVLDCASHPENYIDEIVELNPGKITIIDAADFGGDSGDIRIIEKEQIPETSLSTHLISLKVIASILEDDTKAEVKFLGIQPKSVSLGEELSSEVKEAADRLIKIILKEHKNA